MYGLWVITGMGYGHRNFLSTKLVDSKCYGLSQVMGYHSMGYLRFDCIVFQFDRCYSIYMMLKCYKLKNERSKRCS